MSETVTMVRERPILFGGALVRAILDGRKTQTRRVVKPQPPEWIHSFGYTCFTPEGHISGRGYWKGVPGEEGPAEKFFRCPYGVPGDRLWVRETWADTNGENGPMVSYRAGGDRFLVDDSYPVDYSRYPGGHFTMWCGDLRRGEPGHSWRPSIHMPRWASRITLEVTDVRVERLQEITEADAIAEGCGAGHNFGDGSARTGFSMLWDSINAGRGYGWDANPWVWVIGFLRIA